MNLNFNTFWSDASGRVAQVWQQVLSEFAQDTWTKPDTGWRPNIIGLFGMTVGGVTINYGWTSNNAQEVRFSMAAQFTLSGTATPYLTVSLPFPAVSTIGQHVYSSVQAHGGNWTQGWSYIDPVQSWIVVAPTGETTFPLGTTSIMVSGSYLRP